MKTMLIIFFDIKGIVHFEFIPLGRTVNQAYYVEISKRLCEAVRRQRLEFRPNNWILHHNYVPAHKAITEIEHPPCSLGLAPNDFWLFQK
jgi:hypothetical protein